METTGKKTHGRPLRALTTTLVLALLAVAILASPVLAASQDGRGASAKPGTPTGKAPTGTVATVTPTFAWSAASGAVDYELQVYQGTKLLFVKTGIIGQSWKSDRALPTNVDFTWKVRARNALGTGAWSSSLKFKVVPGSHLLRPCHNVHDDAGGSSTPKPCCLLVKAGLHSRPTSEGTCRGVRQMG